MNKKKILLFINVISLLLLVTVSFAWINEINTEFSKFFELKYNSLYISPTQVDVKLYRCENNSNIDITQLDKTTAVYTANNVVPGEYSLYVLKLTNKADVAMNVAVNFTNITGSEVFYEFINIGVSYVNGFSDEYPAPPIEDFFLEDRLYDGAATLINDMMLPPHESGDANAVEIKFYIRLSHEATNELQSKQFSLGTINVITI
jgi:hypothetical protein